MALSPVTAGELPGPAVALIEVESLARGMIAADALLKRAPVSIALAEAITPGKYLVLFSGGVAEVQEAFAAGLEVAGAALLDKLLLPVAARSLVDGLRGKLHQGQGESVGIVETHTVASALLAADRALKGAEVRLSQLHLARGIGGKGYFVLTGDLHQVEAGLQAAASAIEARLLVTTEILQRPHPELRGPVL